MDETIKRAREIIEEIIYITLATASKKGEPWNSPVFSAYDENYNFYWGSHQKSRHSRNIAETGKAFLVIYDSTVPAGEGEGVYIQATAQELANPDEIKLPINFCRIEGPSLIGVWKSFLARLVYGSIELSPKGYGSIAGHVRMDTIPIFAKR